MITISKGGYNPSGKCYITFEKSYIIHTFSTDLEISYSKNLHEMGVNQEIS